MIRRICYLFFCYQWIESCLFFIDYRNVHNPAYVFWTFPVMIIMVKIITTMTLIIIKRIRVIEKKREERDWEKAIMYYYSDVTSKISNLPYLQIIYFLHTCYIKPKYNTFIVFHCFWSKFHEIMITVFIYFESDSILE